MSRGGKQKKAPSRAKNAKKRPKALLLFGESYNDRRAVKELVEGLRPALEGHVQPRRTPLVLIKGVGPDELVQRKRSLADQVIADRVRLDVRGVIVHEDCDAVEPAHEAAARQYADELGKADFAVYPALPAWELEAWLLLWPTVLGDYRETWRAPTELCGKHVGKIKNAKERLRSAVMPKRLSGDAKKRFRTYEESDSPGIAKTVRARGVLTKPEGRSGSYERFRQVVETIEI